MNILNKVILFETVLWIEFLYWMKMFSIITVLKFNYLAVLKINNFAKSLDLNYLNKVGTGNLNEIL